MIGTFCFLIQKTVPLEKRTKPISYPKSEIHRAKHGLINAETALTLAVHRLLNTVQRSSSQVIVGATVTADKGRTVFYLSKASAHIAFYLLVSPPLDLILDEIYWTEIVDISSKEDRVVQLKRKRHFTKDVACVSVDCQMAF